MKFRINQIHMTTRKREKKTKKKTFLLYSYSFVKILRYVELLGITVCVCVILSVLVIVTVWFMRNV